MQPIKAKRVVMLTGTPISSRPKELFPLIHRLDPASFPNFFEFAKVYCNAHRTRFGWDFNGASNLESLQDKLRRTVMELSTLINNRATYLGTMDTLWGK